MTEKIDAINLLQKLSGKLAKNRLNAKKKLLMMF